MKCVLPDIELIERRRLPSMERSGCVFYPIMTPLLVMESTESGTDFFDIFTKMSIEEKFTGARFGIDSSMLSSIVGDHIELFDIFSLSGKTCGSLGSRLITMKTLILRVDDPVFRIPIRCEGGIIKAFDGICDNGGVGVIVRDFASRKLILCQK